MQTLPCLTNGDDLDLNDLDDYEPTLHERTRRDRLIDQMSDWKRRLNRTSKGKSKSKPKGFKPWRER